MGYDCNLYPLKTLKSLWFSGVYRVYKMGAMARNGLNEFEFKMKKNNLSVNSYSNITFR